MKKLKIHELGRLSPEEFKHSPKIPAIVVLDNIRSGLNVGSVFRTCDAFAVQQVILTGITPKPPHREIHKTAIGATDAVEWVYIEDVFTAVKALRDQGLSVNIVEQTTGSSALDAIQFDRSATSVFVFGNEVSGVTESLLEIADKSIEIPQFGTKHSINVAVSAGIVLWEFCKQVRLDD